MLQRLGSTIFSTKIERSQTTKYVTLFLNIKNDLGLVCSKYLQ